MKLPVKIDGYDKWRLAGPPEWEGPTCDWCGTGGDIRVDESGKRTELICSDCFSGFDDLQSASEYFKDKADLRADYLYDQARDREDSQP